MHTDQHRGFAFVEFEDEQDASEAIDNMDCKEHVQFCRGN